MKVIYRSILKELETAIECAGFAGRTISHIELAPAEWAELQRESGVVLPAGEPSRFMDVELRQRPSVT